PGSPSPVQRWKRYWCHGHTTISPSSKPLPSGPPTWLQVLEITPNLPSLYDTATSRSPSFASRSGARLKSSAAPTSIHSTGVFMGRNHMPCPTLGAMTVSEIERTTMARVTLRLLPFLLLLYIISWLDRVNVGFAQLQLKPDLGFSDTIFGYGASIFFVGYALCEVPSNLLLVRYGARLWIARIMITWGLISIATMFVQGATSFYVLRFLLGMAEAGFLPGIVYYLSQWFPREHRARAVSWFMIGIPLSLIFGGPMSGWIMKYLDEVQGLHGWQWLFLFDGIPAVALFFFIVGSPTEKPADARWLPVEQRAWLTERIAA